MLEQELKPGARQGRTLREGERRRILRNRIIGLGVVLSLSAALLSAVKRELPQWLEMPGNTALNPAQAKPALPVSTGANAMPTAAAMRSNASNVRHAQSAVVKSAPKNHLVRRVLLPAGLGPEILPADETNAPRRRRRRRHTTLKPMAQKATPQQSSESSPFKNTDADKPAPKPADPAPAQPNSKPPDDVPE